MLIEHTLSTARRSSIRSSTRHEKVPGTLLWICSLAFGCSDSELCVGGRGTARYPRRSVGQRAYRGSCPPPGGAPALLDEGNPLEYQTFPLRRAPTPSRAGP